GRKNKNWWTRSAGLPKKTICTRPSHETSGEHDANKANLPGATLAQRPMESRAQLVQNRSRERKRGSGEGVRSCTDRARDARTASRPRPHIRRSQAAQRHVVLYRGVGHARLATIARRPHPPITHRSMT